MSKIFYIDVETTGLDSKDNAMVQLAGIIEINGEERERINFDIAPFEDDIIDQGALDVIGKTEEQLLLYDNPSVIYKALIEKMAKYVDRYNKADKFFFIGYNSRFDDSFVRSWFKKNNDPYYGSWFHWPAIDVSNLAVIELMDSKGGMKNFKLMTVAKELGINVKNEKAHDAMYDIEVTRKIYKLLKDEQ